MSSLRISEVFYSLQGEGRFVGIPTVFVRLTGCPLRCGYCDTEYAFKGGERLEIDEIMHRVAGHGATYVTVTGGEPLAQKDCLILLNELCDAGYEVSLETSGALDISVVDQRVVTVMDLKTPGSGEVDKNLMTNLVHLQKKDQLKFVICDEQDYQWSRDLLLDRDLAATCELLFSPSHGQLSATTLAEWVLRDKLPVRFQTQLHKQLWGEAPGT